MMSIVLLCCLWVLWCTLHSALISLTVTRFLHRRLEPVFHWYRLAFNGFSLITFLVLAVLTLSLDSPAIMQWQGYWILLRVAMLAASVALLRAGAKGYDMGQFLGLSQIENRSSSMSLAETGALDLSGIRAWIRHPWYLATLLFIWSWWWEVRLSFLAVNILLTIYVIIGTILEENKLVRTYGKAYELYQQRVPMLIPCKWPERGNTDRTE
ncbi:MAG: hypothetical protein V1793_23195 [Pseudomonadota bacterium]